MGRGRVSKGPSAGFTLIELVLVLVLIGVLAAVAAPRFIGNQAWAARGYVDAARSALEFGRQAAVAQRRWVCVDVAPGGLTFTRANLSRDDTAAPCGNTQGLILPGSDSPVLAVPDEGIGVSLAGGAASPLIFDGLGRLVDSGGGVLGPVQLQVAGDETYALTIEGSTGHVH